MIKMRSLTIILLLLALLVTPIAALASDISGAQYWASIIVSANRTATNNVATTTIISTQNLIDGNYLAASANNCVARNSSGADIPFMPSVNATYPWCFWVDSIGDYSYLNYILYTANSTGGDINYFPADAGMTTPDHPTLEIADNFTIEVSGWVDTDASANMSVSKSLVRKQGAFDLRVVAAEQINAVINPAELLFEDDFDTDAWTDVGTLVHITVGDERIDYNCQKAAVDNRCHYDLGAGLVLDTYFKLSYTWHFTSTANPGGFNYILIGQFDALANPFGYGTDLLVARYVESLGVQIQVTDGGASTASAYIAVANGNTYYVDLERTSTTTAELSLYSDVARTTHVAGSPVSMAVPLTVTALRYAQVSNYDQAAAGPPTDIGWVADMTLQTGLSEPLSVTATGVSDEWRVATATANTTHFWIDIDGSTKDTVALGGVSVINNANGWESVINGSMPYMSYQSISINGTLQQYVDWEYDTTFYDVSGKGNDATPSFRTASSDALVTAEMVSFRPITESQAPDYALSEAPAFIDADALTSNITSNWAVVPPTGGFPLAGVIVAVADATGTPPQMPLLILAGFVIFALSLSFSYVARKYGSGTIFVKILVVAAIMGVFVALQNFGIDFWMILVFMVIGSAIGMASKQLGFT